jgi:hypothetical protein
MSATSAMSGAGDKYSHLLFFVLLVRMLAYSKEYIIDHYTIRLSVSGRPKKASALPKSKARQLFQGEKNMSNSDVEVWSEGSSKESCWDPGSLPSSSNLGFSSQNNQSHRPEAPGSIHAANLHSDSLPCPLANYCVSSTASTRSTGSYLCATYSEPGVGSILPQTADSASRQPTATDAASTDPILLQFASYSTSAARQVRSFNSDSTLSFGSTDSEDTRSRSEGSNSGEELEPAETSNTSETDHRDEDIFFLDQDPLDPAPIKALLFVGLEFPGEFIKVESLVRNCRCIY